MLDPAAQYANVACNDNDTLQQEKQKPRLNMTKPIQDYYPDAFANCFGCGRNNAEGLHTKTWWDDNEEMGYCKFIPAPHCCGYKAVFHGGLLSSVIECNSVATSVAATLYEEELDPNTALVFYVLGEIENTKFINPVPIKGIVEVKTKVVKLFPRKAICAVEVYGNGTLCTTARTITVRVADQIIRTAFLDAQSE